MVQLDYDKDTFIYTQKILFYLKDALSENNLTSTDMLFIFTHAPFCNFVKNYMLTCAHQYNVKISRSW